jgi:hypothetical protein
MIILRRIDEHLYFPKIRCEIPLNRRGRAAVGHKMGLLKLFMLWFVAGAQSGGLNRHYCKIQFQLCPLGPAV